MLFLHLSHFCIFVDLLRLIFYKFFYTYWCGHDKITANDKVGSFLRECTFHTAADAVNNSLNIINAAH